jgi:hypothetical protein
VSQDFTPHIFRPFETEISETHSPCENNTMKLLNVVMIVASCRAVSSFVPAARAHGGSPGSSTSRHLFNKLFATTTTNSKYPIIADESIMSKKSHGTSEKPVQRNLRWKCDYDTADRIW